MRIGGVVAFLVSLFVANIGVAQVQPQYGTASNSVYVVPATEFIPTNGVALWATSGGQERYRTVQNIGGTDITSYIVWDAALHLPSGALITGIEVDYCDTAASGDVWAWVAVGSAFGTNPPVFYPQNSSAKSVGAPGCAGTFADLQSASLVVNNNLNLYTVRARLDATDSSNSLKAVKVFYKLQVSPAPQTATFSDVPTTHPFFQYVEALAAAGITGGCAPGQYCPDAPITRGQMAVFLSRALGLHWTP